MAEPYGEDRILEALPRDDVEDQLLRDFVTAALRRAPDHLLRRDPSLLAARLHVTYGALVDRPLDEPLVRWLEEHHAPEGTGPRAWSAYLADGVRGTLEVLCEDRPFLLSTVRAELEAAGLRVTGSFHPILGVERDADGRLERIVPARDAVDQEAVIHVEVTGPDTVVGDERLLTAVRERLEAVRRVTDDHGAMRATIERAIVELTAAAEDDGGEPPAEDPVLTHTEVADLLRWMLADNLVLLGVEDTDGTRLGLCATVDPPTTGTEGEAPLVVSRTRQRSPVQRQVPMEVLDVVRPASGGRVRIIGLLTRKGTAEPAIGTPVLRRRLPEVLRREDIVDGSHEAVTLAALFQALPKDELLRCSTDELHALLLALLDAEEQRTIRLVVRPHRPSHTVSVLAAVPKDRWSVELRQAFARRLRQAYDASGVEVDVAVDDRHEALARFVVACDLDAGAPDVAALETSLVQLARPWEQALHERLATLAPEGQDRASRTELVERFPATYREAVTPDAAVHDVELLRPVAAPDGPALRLALRSDEAPGHARLVAAKRGEPLELSAFLPILESLGLTVVDEIPHRLEPDGGALLSLHDFGLRASSVEVEVDGPRLTAAIAAAWAGDLEVDALNGCVLTAGLDHGDVALLRAYRRYRRQLGTAYTASYVDEIVVGNPRCVRALVAHVHARLDPGWTGPDEDATRERVTEELDALQRLDHDRVLRGLLHLIDATLRTNAFRDDAVADGTGEPFLAFKVDPSQLAGLPAPVPYREIFVHSPRMEGIHLRGGPVARGGLRWSDRRDDVRSEVLDLVKAQVLKNAVIVPTGAKGGFVVTREPSDPAELRAEVQRQYVTFVRGLLDVTDDLDGDTIVPPPGVRRRDGDDPYLVVAADRGTATFSDIANGLAQRYGFWLDDAFASGGSQGYDHKALGVTARGAWVAVERHARELGIDANRDPMTVAGVGDMSGDVFGNALLRSRSVRLIAAFDHRHVFVDPDPDPAASYAERERLFSTPGSSWDDYDREVLGADGLVVARTAKRVPLNETVREALRIDAEELSPPALIQAILRAPVDLFFAGGIGTYVKASTERNEELGDRSNDELRVDATEVRARIVGEGANLFITQRGRIELARRGGRLNQDAVDNAAGVITSDLEVNIKILLRLAEDRHLLDRDQRDGLLAELSDDVVASVLTTVDRQAAAISREAARSPGLLDAYVLLTRRLERTSGLDRHVEVLPSDEELATRGRAGAGLTRPELATLLAWAKRELKESLLASAVPDEPAFSDLLDTAFPARLVARFPELPAEHRLRRELIATRLANDLVDRMGVTFAARLAEETGSSLPEVVRTFHVLRSVVDADRWWAQLDELETLQDPARVRELEEPLEELLATLTRVLLTDPTAAEPLATSERQRRTVDAVLAGVAELGTSDQRRARLAYARWLVDDLIDPSLARLLASVRELELLPDVDAVMARLPVPRGDIEVLDALLRLGADLGIDDLEARLRQADHLTGWARRERLGLSLDLRRARRVAAATALAVDPAEDAPTAVEAFLAGRRRAIRRVRDVLGEAETAELDSLDALAVVARAIRETIERPPEPA